MLKIQIDLDSAISPDRDAVLGKAVIYNDATGTAAKGNYKYKIYRKGSDSVILREGEIKDFPRKRLTSWDLLYRVLREAYGERNRNGDQASS